MPALWAPDVSPVLQRTPATQSPVLDAKTLVAILSRPSQNPYDVSNLSTFGAYHLA
jgi:hypothetical protein